MKLIYPLGKDTYTINLVHKDMDKIKFYCGKGTPIDNSYYVEDKSMEDEVYDRYEEWFRKNNTNPNVSTYLYKILNHLKKHKQVSLSCPCVFKRCYTLIIARWLFETLTEQYINQRGE